ncbi:MAG: hypothetical protein QOG67_2817 [Verrucomicrobiota bacterium]|jgi:hypothetical protein
MKLTCGLLLAAVTATCYGSIDFTPTTAERVLDGIKFQQLIFHENGRKISYEQPRAWRYAASASQIVFTPPNITQAEGVIDQSRLEKPENFDEATMKSLQDQVLASVANAQSVTLVSAEKNPLLINRHETFEVTIAYQIGGVEFERSVLFLNLPDTQLRFRVTANKRDFEKVHQAFRGSIFSWQWSS